MIARLKLFVVESFPLRFFIPYSLVYAFGMTGLFAATDGRITHWTPGFGLLTSAATLMIDQLIIRALDDIRDLDYDRRYNPARPLARGAVRRSDLVALIVAGVAFVLAINAGRGAADLILVVQLIYLVVLAAIEKRFDWPRDGQLLTNLAVSYPIQLALSVYLYADWLSLHALAPAWQGVLVILAAAVGLLHLELARKVTRTPRDGERTYVRIFGVRNTVRIAAACAAITSLIVVALLQPWANPPRSAWGWAALLPLMPVVIGRLKFNDPALPRWPLRYAAWYILVMYASFLFVGLATLGRQVA
ncbi:hypothetical protein BPA30113_00006 [Burkholderia paludis]|uniref:Prenyltransferase n=2 Tax=Burkholderiaceae TaxID=119060 RepID=A0A6J5DDA4_9BURK|nr:hypothetical protein LMG30113_01472 [Burkholderia paludis]VWB06863.1 hypothetical protein BPA30113_00006 [Burkholderia paludis]